MKKLILGISLIMMLGFTSCEPEPICGRVSNHNFQNFGDHTDYYLYINGEVSRKVDFETYNKYKDDDYYCFE